jgi:hypothetical protein
LGAGNILTIASNMSSMPSPVLPEQLIALEVSMPITSSISFLVFAKSDAGRSILFKIGIT